MDSAIIIDLLEQLAKFQNKDGIIEIAIRGENKKFTAFQKIILGNVTQEKGKETIKQAISLINKNNELAEKSLSLLSNVANLQSLSLILGGANLCATCAGFAIMYAKLDKMSGQINQLMNVVKQGNEVQADYEFKKIISEHANMLDCRKTQKYYTEEQMRKLVDDEYNVLNMLLDVFIKDLATDQDSMILSIFSLASMLAISLRYFDELYYFNNKEVIGDGDVWHSSHSNWVAVFDRLSSSEVMERIQDHGFIDMELSTYKNDIYCTSLYDQVQSLKEDVEDNQALILALDDAQILADFNKAVNDDVADNIKKAFEQTPGFKEDEDAKKAVNDALKQVAFAG